jgi:WD40 repeat protein
MGNGTVRVPQWPSNKDVHVWPQLHRGGIWGMRLSPNGETLATAGKDGYVENVNVLHELQHPGETNGVAFTHDGDVVVTGCDDSQIRLFDVAECNDDL